VRDQVVAPAFGAVAGGVEVLLIEPVGRAVARARRSEPATPSKADIMDSTESPKAPSEHP